MQVLEEVLQVYFSANKCGSVGTILQLFFIQRFCNETDIFAYFEKAGRLWNISFRYIFPIAFNDETGKILFFYQMKIQMKTRF